jgi:hypothetical protein
MALPGNGKNSFIGMIEGLMAKQWKFKTGVRKGGGE